MSKQTAVDWMRQSIENTSIHWGDEFFFTQKGEIINYIVIKIQHEKLDEFLTKAKQMEKEQIIDAFHSKKIINTISAEQYYQETYGGDHE
jgi:ribosome biogenesis SPOUT family RNA methylase Rps3